MRKGEKATEEQRQRYRDGAKKRRSYSGENNPKWRGGKTTMKDGRTLVFAPNHPDANCIGGKYILEYRLIAEKKIGRRLMSNEIVHHINGDVTDNRAENLEIMTQAEHASIHSRKLTPIEVWAIRQTSGVTNRKLATQYGVSDRTISSIKNRTSWRDI